MMNIEKISPEMANQLTQDPHSTSEGDREKVLEVAIGREVRAYRRPPRQVTLLTLACPFEV